jgi:hypothetical protein
MAVTFASLCVCHQVSKIRLLWWIVDRGNFVWSGTTREDNINEHKSGLQPGEVVWLYQPRPMAWAGIAMHLRCSHSTPGLEGNSGNNNTDPREA